MLEIVVSTTSDATFSLAQAWLADCMTSDIHFACRQKLDKESHGIPDRLLDVGPPDGPDSSNLSKKRKEPPNSSDGEQGFEHPRAQKLVKARNAVQY